MLNETTKTTKEKKMTDFNNLIKTNTTTKTTSAAKKKAVEIIEVPNNIQDEIKNLLQAKKDKKVAESKIKKAETPIIDFGLNLKNEKAFNGSFQKSYKLGNDDDYVTFVTANKWSFAEDDVEIIKETIGEKADELIEEETVVKLKSEVFSNPELQDKFVKMVGEAFPEFFETVVSHHVSDKFDEEVYKLGKEKFEAINTLMKQSKPSLR